MASRPAPSETRPDTHPVLGRLAFLFVVLALAALVAVPVLVRRRVDAVRAEVQTVAEPARTLVTRLQFSLSREMAALRGFLLTGEERDLEPYPAARAAERLVVAELEPLAGRLGPEVRASFAETRARVDRWHAVAGDDAISARREPDVQRLAEIRSRRDLFEEALRAAAVLDSAIVRESRRRADEIRSLESAGVRLSVLLALLALGAASAVGWLDRRVRRLAAEAEQRRSEVESAFAASALANEARARMLRGVTHDLKNPLGAANGYVALLEMGVKGELNGEQAALVAGIRRSIDGGLRIIADLLDVARADNGALPVTVVPTDVAALAAEAVADHRAAAEAAGLALSCEVGAAPLVAPTDPARIRQVLGNLLSNAIKYTPAPGTVRVLAESVAGGPSRRPGRWAVVRVCDSGPGVPPDEREAVFDEFSRLDGGRGAEGHGIGLAIGRRIARILGGDVTVDDAPDGGAAFTLWLPAAAPDADAARPPIPFRDPRARRR